MCRLEHHLQRYQFLTVGDFVQIPLDKENGIQFEVTDVRIDDETRVESISTVDVDLLTTIESYKNESGGESAGNEANNMEMKSDETSEITLGEESMQNVPCGEYKHLRVSVKDKEDAVVIAVRPITGDPDVYVSLTDKNEQPDWTNYDVCDQTEGTRVLRVDALQSNNIYIGLHDYNNRVNSKCVVVVFYESDNGLKEKYCGRKLIDAASSGSSDANNTIDHGTCMFCGQKIPKAGMRLHELRCKRMNFKCEKCGTVAPARRKEKHMKLAHTKIQCQCGVELEQEALQAHRQRECPYQIGVCRYCGLSLRQGDLGEHQEVCGSKSYTCAHCGKNILRRNFLEHLHIQHKINSINLKNDTK